MFHKEKYKADGSFDKDKCRIVLLSNLRDPNMIGDSFSSTVNTISVMTQLNVATMDKNTIIAAYGAFLLTPVEELDPNQPSFGSRGSQKEYSFYMKTAVSILN